MTTIQAWERIISEWNCHTWTPIPQDVREVLKFHAQLGMCSGNLCTRKASEGMTNFCNKLNHLGDKK